MSLQEIRPSQYIDYAIQKPDVPEGELFDAWRVKIMTPQEFNSLSLESGKLSEEQLAYLAWFDLLSPTTHNTVPQRLQVDSKRNAILIGVDRQFILPESDKIGRQTEVSVGCGITNIVRAAQCYGLEGHVEVLPGNHSKVRPYVASDNRYVRLAQISFSQGNGEALDPAWLQAMVDRKVVRAEYDETIKLPPELEATIKRYIAETYPHITLHLSSAFDIKLAVGKFQKIADTTVFNRDGFALELGEWLLDNNDWDNDGKGMEALGLDGWLTGSRRDISKSLRPPVGMRGREFGLSDDTKASRIHKGLLRQEHLLPDEIAGFAKSGNIGIRSSSAVGVITVKEDSIEQRIEAGRAYEDVALLLHQQGFVTSVHAGITEVEGPNMMLRARLGSISKRPTVVFRTGKVLKEEDGKRSHSVRPSLPAIALPEGFEG